jgi:hypothetical protein
MFWSSGCTRAAALLVTACCALSHLGPARAQDDEVISDPELESTPRQKKRPRTDDNGDEVIADPELQHSDNPSKTLRGGEEVIMDPELGGGGAEQDGWGDVYQAGRADAASKPAAPAREDDYDPMANTGISHLQALGQFGADLRHEENLEDAYESRLRFDAEIEFRRSKKTRLSIGTRVDLLWAVPWSGDRDMQAQRPDGSANQFNQDRFELDILPLSAYVDVTPANGFHVRVGEQTVSIARMDFYSPIDMLAAFDMRGQPGLGQSSGKLAQPAVRVDWDLSSWATLQVVYLPWFMPNLARPNRDRYVAGLLGNNSAFPAAFDRQVDPSFRTKVNEDGLRFVGPAPDFTTPQGQARLNMRGDGFEVGVSAGSALEKLPSIYTTPVFENYLRDPEANKFLFFQQVDAGAPPFDVAYHRYQQVSVDGSFELAPLNLGFELAFSPSRHLVAARLDAAHLPQPNVSRQIVDAELDAMNHIVTPGNVSDKSIRKGVPLLQGAVHVDWLHGETFAIAVEAFFVQALERPYDRDRDWLAFAKDKALYAGGILGATYRPNPDAGRWRFDASVAGVLGPSLIFMPQVEYRVLDALYLNVGLQLFEGPTPMRNGKPIQGGAQSLNVGGLLSGYDQVYAGFRFVP